MPVALTARVPLALGTVMFRLAVRVAWLKLLVKPSLVPSRNLSTPVLPAVLPRVRALLPCSDRVLKVTLELVAMSWMVLMAPRLELKLVALKLAIPFTVVLALSMVMAVPEVRALLMVRLPLMADEPEVVPVMSTTPPPAPPPLARQVGQVRLPVVAFSTSGPEALTAIVPEAVGRSMSTSADGAVPTLSLVWLVLVELLKIMTPVREPAVPTARLPLAVTVLPASVRMESAIAPDELNFAIFPGVPPAVVTPPPTPVQLPAVVQTK